MTKEITLAKPSTPTVGVSDVGDRRAWTKPLLVAGAALVLLAVWLTNVNDAWAGWVSRVEVLRVASPDAKFDAVVIESDGGATTSLLHAVFVVPSRATAEGHPCVAQFSAAGSIDGAVGVVPRWGSATELVIEFRSARRAELLQPTLTLAGRKLDVRLDQRP